MELPVPGTKPKWETRARQNDVPTTQLFSDCSALPSGSGFMMEHYLALRILVVDEKSLTKKNRRFRAKRSRIKAGESTEFFYEG